MNKLNTHTLRRLFIVVAASLSMNASAQEEMGCEPGKTYAADAACHSLPAILKNYRNAVSIAEHQALMTSLRDLHRALLKESIQASGLAAADGGDFWVERATLLWLDWYQVAVTARAENRQLLESENWRALLSLAHRDPYAALAQLNQAGKPLDDHHSALRLLLAGMLTNHLQTLAEAANLGRDNSNSLEKFNTYVSAHQQDFNTGETCYGGNYTGQHFAAVEKRFKASSYAEAAAYLTMTITPCGECEGDFSCYLSRNMVATKEFIAKYPNSTYVAMLLKRAQLAIVSAFSEKEAQSDYLSGSEYYTALDAANVLTRFEGALKNVAPAELSGIKFALGDLYIKLNQPGNAKRVVEWLSVHVPDALELPMLKQSLNQMQKLALTLNKPKPHGPHMLALEWTPRPGFSDTPLQIWRAETPDFTQAIALGAVLPPGTLSAVDSSIQSDVAYWYRIDSAGENRKSLSHAAFAQTWYSQTFLREIIFDRASQSLYAIGRVPENFATRLLLHVPGKLSAKEGHTKDLNPKFASPLTLDPWWIDKDSGVVLMADQTALKVNKLDLAQANKSAYSGSEQESGVTIDLAEKQLLSVKGGLSSRAPDGKSVYVWDKKGKLLRTDFAGITQETLFDEAALALTEKDRIKAFYLFVRRNGEVWLVGQKQALAAGKLFTMRKLSRGSFADIDVEKGQAYDIGSAKAWQYDAQRDALWLAGVDGQPGLFGMDGKQIKKAAIKLQNGKTFSGAQSLTLDPVTGDVYISNSAQIVKLHPDGKSELVWEFIPNASTEQLSAAKLVAERKKALEKNYLSRQCELSKQWLGDAPVRCRDADLAQ